MKSVSCELEIVIQTRSSVGRLRTCSARHVYNCTQDDFSGAGCEGGDVTERGKPGSHSKSVGPHATLPSMDECGRELDGLKTPNSGNSTDLF